MSSTSQSPPHTTLSFQTLGLGYSIAIALGFLVLLSTLLLSSYLCCRSRSRSRRRLSPPSHSPPPSGIIVPRVFFVAEDDDSNSNPSSLGVGIDHAVINSYPKFQFYKANLPQNDLESNNNSENECMCSICLCEYKEGEMLRMMPDCKHYFHLCCLDAWLKLNGSCPVCRNSPLPTPVSTPLAEVMPLSLYPDNRRRSAVISSSS